MRRDGGALKSAANPHNQERNWQPHARLMQQKCVHLRRRRVPTLGEADTTEELLT